MATQKQRDEQPKIPQHPDYVQRRPELIKVYDCLAGEDTIKEKGEDYLPKTSGQSDTPAAYTAYVARAVYMNFAENTLTAAKGKMAREKAEVELPTELTSLIHTATPNGDDMQELLDDINEGQIKDGRYGLLVDVPEGEAPESPWIAKYGALSIINWATVHVGAKEVLTFLALDESHYEIQCNGTHQYVDQYRVCGLYDPALQQSTPVEGALNSIPNDPNVPDDSLAKEGSDSQLTTLGSDPVYWTKVLTASEYAGFDSRTFIPAADDIPEYREKPLDFIPFVFINVDNTDATPQKSPLLDVCNLSIAVYRGEADYRQSLFMQGQATPYGVGINSDERVQLLGAQSMIWANNPEAKLGFMEVSGAGLSEMRQSQEDLKRSAAEKGSMLVDFGSERESGKALSIRQGSKTEVLKTIALTGAEGLRTALQYALVWSSDATLLALKEATEPAVVIAPNLDFSEEDGESLARQLNDLAQARYVHKAPIRDEDIWAFMFQNDIVQERWEDAEESVRKDRLNQLELDAKSTEGGETAKPNTSQSDNTGGTSAPGSNSSESAPASFKQGDIVDVGGIEYTVDAFGNLMRD